MKYSESFISSSAFKLRFLMLAGATEEETTPNEIAVNLG